MKLQYDCKYLSSERKKAKNGVDFLCVTCCESVTNKIDKVCFFDSKLFDIIENLQRDALMVIFFNYYYSAKLRKNVLIAYDVVLCQKILIFFFKYYTMSNIFI